MRIITEPTIEPVSLSEVKLQIGIQTTDTLSDALINLRIREARSYAENYMQRAINTQTQEIRLDAFPLAESGNYFMRIKLPFPNLLTIVSVKYIDTDGTLITMGAPDFALDSHSKIGAVMPIFGTVWPVAREEVGSVRIQYTCGYGPAMNDVPALIREAIKLTVGHWMNFQQQVENGVTMTRVPFAVRDILDQYAIVEPV